MASVLPPFPVPLPSGGNKKKDKTPQELVGDFWDKYFSKKPGKVTSIFPRSLYKTLLPAGFDRDDPRFDGSGAHSARNAAESYAAAAKECRERVRRIVNECNRTNEKFTDPDFDIESDWDNNCLNGLVRDDGRVRLVDGLGVSAGELRQSLDTLVNSRVLGADAAVPMDVGAVRGFINDSNPWAALLGDGDASSTASRKGARSAAGNGRLARLQDKAKVSPHAQARVQATGKEGDKTARSRHDVMGGERYFPESVHRVDWIFDSPQFTVDGYAASDIKQGKDGDCWWLAAVATIAHRKDLMEKVCVARDEECGVYGFVFQRDGEWVSVVVDDNLYLEHADFDFYGDVYDSTGRRAREHRRRYQTGSEALYFAKCADKNETWLPLLEKAYAKAHGDYEALSGGWSGEAVEDMTGGVTTTIATNRVLRRNILWKELVNADGEFVFALSALGTGWDWTKGGLALGHAYSILQAREEVDDDGKKVRLVKIRNPWGERAWNGIGEWNGPWSDGSKEWTPYWLKKINHTFGDDGLFWMSYDDMLSTFLYLHRTRLFDDKWTVVQQWTSVNVGWVSGFLNTKFLVQVKKSGKLVFVLTQLDERYYLGLEGQYDFTLHFILQEENGKVNEHICRVRPVHDWENRSVSCEVELQAGRYEVLPKIDATRDESRKFVEDVVKESADSNPQKLRQVGISYDLAHAKGGVPDEDDILLKKREEEKRKAEEKKRKRKEKAKKEKDKLKKSRHLLEITLKGNDQAGDKEKGEKKDEKKEEDKKESEKESSKEESKEDDGAKRAESKESSKPGTSSTSAAKPGALQRTSTRRDFELGKEEEKREDKKEDKKEEKKEEEKKEDKEEKKEEEKQEDQDEKKEDNDEDDDEDDDDDDKDKKKDDDDKAEDDDSGRTPWNAVCVVGLRVYSQDPDVTIALVKPKDPEEGATLALSSQPPGATM